MNNSIKEKVPSLLANIKKLLATLKSYCVHYWKRIASVAVIVCVLIAISIYALNIDAYKVKNIYNNCEKAGDVIFATTQDGSLLYVPINDKEAVMEQSTAVGESLYLWLETGYTVSITDDVIATNQVGLYDMLIAVVESGRTVKQDGNYISTVTGLDKVFNMMTRKWLLTEGHAMGSLSCYNENLASANVSMELVTRTEQEKVYFKLNLFIDDTGYTIYNGRILEQHEQDLPKFDAELYNLNGIVTITKNENMVEAYAKNAINYFYELALFLDVEELDTGGIE